MPRGYLLAGLPAKKVRRLVPREVAIRPIRRLNRWRTRGDKKFTRSSSLITKTFRNTRKFGERFSPCGECQRNRFNAKTRRRNPWHAYDTSRFTQKTPRGKPISIAVR